ncbi:MAG: phosphatidate cytidylyltransferase [Bacteroidota bacterium]|nr:phosphatidate cytidylyltransferase [Bacteroidota bacterium]
MKIVSNLAIRSLTAIIGIPVIILVSIAGGIYFLLFTIIASTLALREFYKLAEAKGAKPLMTLGLAAGVLVNLSFYHKNIKTFIVDLFEKVQVFIPFPSQAQLLLIITLGILLVFMLVEMFRNDGSAITNLSATVMGIFYVSLFFGTLIGLRELFVPFDFPVYRFFLTELNPSDATVAKIYLWGGYTIITIFATIWICDTAAYFGGKFLGKHKLFERVSPNKTWEGAIAGFLFAIVAAVAAKYFLLEYFTLQDAIVLGAVVGIFGQLGDLVESLLKRDAGIKDSSSLIPGHGGVLDRFDSLLFVSPVFYLYLDFIVFS